MKITITGNQHADSLNLHLGSMLFRQNHFDAASCLINDQGKLGKGIYHHDQPIYDRMVHKKLQSWPTYCRPNTQLSITWWLIHKISNWKRRFQHACLSLRNHLLQLQNQKLFPEHMQMCMTHKAYSRPCSVCDNQGMIMHYDLFLYKISAPPLNDFNMFHLYRVLY